MKRLIYSLFGTMVFTLILTACGTPSGGPQTWLDWPLDDSTHPLEPLTLQAHASDEDGIGLFEYYANDTLLFKIDADGSRLGEAIAEWAPAEPGVYKIDVRAIDTSGNTGSNATAVITVDGKSNFDESVQITDVECSDGLAVNVDINIIAPDGIVSYSVFSTWVAAEVGESFTKPLPGNINKRVQLVEPYTDDMVRNHQIGLKVEIDGAPTPRYAYAFEPNNLCPGHYQAPVVVPPPGPTAPLATAHTNANCRGGPGIDYAVITSLSEGQSAAIVGRSTDSSWWVLDPGIGGEICWISGTVVDVTGEITGVAVISAPPLPAEPPVADEPPVVIEPLAPVDTTPPSFFSTGVSPDLILTEGGGCPSYKRTITLAAAISDESGLSSVIADWYIGGAESGQVTLSEGGLGYWATIGPVNTVGAMEVYITARDTFGNVSESDTLYVTVNNCIE